MRATAEAVKDSILWNWRGAPAEDGCGPATYGWIKLQPALRQHFLGEKFFVVLGKQPVDESTMRSEPVHVYTKSPHGPNEQCRAQTNSENCSHPFAHVWGFEGGLHFRNRHPNTMEVCLCHPGPILVNIYSMTTLNGEAKIRVLQFSIIGGRRHITIETGGCIVRKELQRGYAHTHTHPISKLICRSVALLTARGRWFATSLKRNLICVTVL